MKAVDVVRRAANNKLLLAKKNSPHIFFGLGVVGVLGATVLACKATLKLEEKLHVFKEEIDEVKEEFTHDTNELDEMVVTKSKAYQQKLAMVYGKNGFELAKLYAPAAGVMALSIAALTGSHVQLTRRNTALMSAYALVSRAFENYRERVKEEIGIEKELDIYHAVEKQTAKELEKNGKIVDPDKFGAYTRIFDEYNRYWQRDPASNRMWIRSHEKHANDLLVVRGHVLLNDMYDALGFDRTPSGALVGWKYDPEKNPHGHIDLGLFDARNARFINGWEYSVVLDFNVDGVVYHDI